MKKIILTFFIVITFTSGSGAQDVSKVETMNWIASKLQKYLVKKPDGPDYKFEFRQFHSFYDGKFLYKRNYESDDETDCGYNIIQIDLNNITGYNYSYHNFEIRGNDLVSIYSSKSKCGVIDLENTTSFNLCLVGEENLFELNLENELLDRMEKAVKHLITLNTKRNGEKF